MQRWVVLIVGCFAAGGAWMPAVVAQTPPLAQQFYGTWYTYPLGNPNTDPVRHEFRHNPTTGKDEMIVTRLCVGDYRSVTARAVSPIEISENTIRVLKSASDSQEAEGNSVCWANIEAGVWSYTTSEEGNRITITNPGGNPDILELARQDAASEATLPANLLGSWLLPPFDQKDTRIQIRFVFYNSEDSNKGNLRQIMSCSKGGDSLIAQVDSAISVSKDQITIQDSASHEEHDGAFTCKATLTAEILHYVLSPSGEIMTLSKPGEKPLTLTRER